MSGNRSSSFHHLLIFFAICLLLSSVNFSAFAAGEDEALRQFGADILAKAPKDVKSGTQLQKARYAFIQYCTLLDKNDVGVNDGYWSRWGTFLTQRDSKLWTCGYHSNNLMDILKGMGIQSAYYLMTDANQTIPSPNEDHGAMALVDRGKIYLFDAWMLAEENNHKYSGSETSKWNGMGIKDWEKEMKQHGYVRFGDGSTTRNEKGKDVPTWYPTTDNLNDKWLVQNKAGVVVKITDVKMVIDPKIDNIKWKFNRLFQEVKGTGVTYTEKEVITEGEDESSGTQKSAVSIHINGKGTAKDPGFLDIPPHRNKYQATVTAIYRGKDDNGQSIESKAVFKVDKPLSDCLSGKWISHNLDTGEKSKYTLTVKGGIVTATGKHNWSGKADGRDISISYRLTASDFIDRKDPPQNAAALQKVNAITRKFVEEKKPVVTEYLTVLNHSHMKGKLHGYAFDYDPNTGEMKNDWSEVELNVEWTRDGE